MKRSIAVYARQSVDKKDSISIDSQVEFCEYELKGEKYEVYCDKGFSGKNTDRPQFQQLVKQIESGLIGRVVVYRLDRISRSILDFAKMMELFQKFNVEFVSSTEKFDTSTAMGRAMLNICIVFAQLERESIQQRLTDSYYSRSQKGFKMGGKVPYGFRTEPFEMGGIKTKRLAIEPTEAAYVKQMFEMYAKPEVSLLDVVCSMLEQGMKTYCGNPFIHTTLRRILRNPSYVMADMDVYHFYRSQGTIIESDPADFAGINGCYYYKGRGNDTDKQHSYDGHRIVVAPHAGFIPADLWLAVNKKFMGNKQFQPARKASNTWLAGKLKCGRCGYALSIAKSGAHQYLRCNLRLANRECEGGGPMRLSEMEALIYAAMVEKLKAFKVIQGQIKSAKANPKLTAKQAELARVESEIDNLIDSLKDASSTLMSYVNAKIEELDTKRRDLSRSVAAMTIESSVSPERIAAISDYLGNWDNISFDEKRQVADALITRVRATSENVAIEWKI